MDKEILDEFVSESKALIGELSQIVDKIEEEDALFPDFLLEEFAQKIDRIMGAAKTMALTAPMHSGLVQIGKMAELCKALGYTASKRKDIRLLPIFAGFWGDVIDVMTDLIAVIDDTTACSNMADKHTPYIVKRLEWLAKKVAPMGVSGAAPSEARKEGPMGQLDVESLMKGFGLQ